MENKKKYTIIIFKDGTSMEKIECCSFVLGFDDIKNNSEVRQGGELVSCAYLASGVDAWVKRVILDGE